MRPATIVLLSAAFVPAGTAVVAAPTAPTGPDLDTVCVAGFEDSDCDALTGVSCDGADTDRCREGALVCSNQTVLCSDITGPNLEVCNSQDDDCDPATPDGAGDPLQGLPCDGLDGDLCLEGFNQCMLGALVCNDMTATNAELCNGVDDDCDQQVDEDSPRDTNPQCPVSIQDLGSVSGDTPGAALVRTGFDEGWFVFTLTEDAVFDRDLLAVVTLSSSVGADFDLYVRCQNCGDLGITTPTDVVGFRVVDLVGNQSRTIIVEVRHDASDRCAPWQLTIAGDTGSATTVCP